jgi:hypothetical protein
MGPGREITRPLGAVPYPIKPSECITIVCAQLPQDMLGQMPYTDPMDTDFIDSLLELFGHLRVTNPTSHVARWPADQLSSDRYIGRLVSIAMWTDAVHTGQQAWRR